jgi:hypothetical protein
MLPEIKILLDHIERKVDWGDAATWQNRDFETLSGRILEETGVSLSASTLKRVWGRVQYEHEPSAVTLDTLARFAGFENNRDFLRRIPRDSNQPETSAARGKKNLRLILIIAAALVILGIAAIFAFKRAPLNPNQYRLQARKISVGIPNSVLFTYDATASPTDSVFIQQSWHPEQREWVSRSEHQHTSIYYKPGYFLAKLIVKDVIVQEYPLLITSQGWLGMIDTKPVPIYLKPEEFLNKDLLGTPRVRLDQGKPERVRFYNVGNFEPVPVKNLGFRAEVKNTYGEGAGACMKTLIYLITDDGHGTILFPLSAKGCVSDLDVYAVDKGVSGKDADLSGFGVDTGWNRVECTSRNNQLDFAINGRSGYSFPLPKQDVHVVGIEFIFEGTGYVKDILLDSAGKPVFSAF